MKRSRLSRSTPLDRPRKKPRSIEEREAAAAWARGLALALDAVDGEPGTPTDPIEGHHVVSKEAIKKLARSERWTATKLYLVVWDPRNRMPVRQSRHDRHTRAVERIPFSAIPEPAFEFAREHGFGWFLERYYPKEVE